MWFLMKGTAAGGRGAGPRYVQLNEDKCRKGHGSRGGPQTVGGLRPLS